MRYTPERFALPWLERMADPPSARDELARIGNLWWAAAASLELGEHSTAARLFAQALVAAPARARILSDWGRANGMPLP